MKVPRLNDGVAPDGSPVDVYLALSPGDTPALIDSQLDPRSSILELGSGPGRITHPLVALGHDVVAVDDSSEMLEHIRGAETVLADLFALDLERSFDAVVAGSHLINQPSRDRRVALLEVCRRHAGVDGVVLIERYQPDWAADPKPSNAYGGNVHIRFEPLTTKGRIFSGRVTYTLDGMSWSQTFSAARLAEEELVEEAAGVGLTFAGWVDGSATWARLVPA